MSVQQRIRTALINWIPLVGYLTLIFYLSHSSQPTQGMELPVSDKLVHAIEFFPLPFLFFRILRSSAHVFLVRNYFLIGISLALLYAIGDECHQAFIPLRDPSLYDFYADSIGILVGACILR